MKSAMLGVLLFLSVTVFCQEAKNGPAPKRSVVSGRVSHDGKVFVSDTNQSWDITNPALLKAYQGKDITVQYCCEAQERRIRVLSIVKTPAATRYTSNLGDAAFRR